MKAFNVIVFNFNKNDIEPYDVIPYFIEEYKERVKDNKRWHDSKGFIVPKTRKELKAFIESKSQYQFWARCEYEIIIGDWPPSGFEKKIDVHQQIMMNIDTITDILSEELKIK